MKENPWNFQTKLYVLKLQNVVIIDLWTSCYIFHLAPCRSCLDELKTKAANHADINKFQDSRVTRVQTSDEIKMQDTWPTVSAELLVLCLHTELILTSPTFFHTTFSSVRTRNVAEYIFVFSYLLSIANNGIFVQSPIRYCIFLFSYLLPIAKHCAFIQFSIGVAFLFSIQSIVSYCIFVLATIFYIFSYLLSICNCMFVPLSGDL